jgi:hypothetical protein
MDLQATEIPVVLRLQEVKVEVVQEQIIVTEMQVVLREIQEVVMEMVRPMAVQPVQVVPEEKIKQ